MEKTNIDLIESVVLIERLSKLEVKYEELSKFEPESSNLSIIPNSNLV